MQIPHSAPPHGDESVLTVGNTTSPTKALILLHGRGATAHDIMCITARFAIPEDVLVLAPQAAHNSWYPERFIMSQSANQPNLNSALERITTLVSFLATEFKIPTHNIALAGFSQGACLVAEYVKRHPMRYLGVAIFSGGLIGDELEVLNSVGGSMDGTPTYLGCDEEDFHIPAERVRATATYFAEHSAEVTLRLYSGIGHTIHGEGLEFLQGTLN